MKFKEWLLNEEGNAEQDNEGGASGEEWGWDLIYPTTAYDYADDVSNPKWFWWWQWRMKRGMEIGRPLYNINTDILDVDFVAPTSTDMPDGQPTGFWKHVESKRPTLTFPRQQNLDRIGVSEGPDKPLVMTGPMADPGIEIPPLPVSDLEKLFGPSPPAINQLTKIPRKDIEGGPRRK